MDKPADITSAAVVRRIKRLPGIYKVGHAGTLDPFATGVLVCTVNQGTRISRFFLHGRKKYAATMRVGTTTDTQDHTGKVLAEKPVGEISENAIVNAFQKFTGDIEQLPPSYSALKHNGVPLYRYARNGTFIQKPARKVNISRIEIRKIQLPDIEFDIQCSGGTYIRTICSDVGEILGCGGHLRKLDRLESSGFSRDKVIDLDTLEQLKTAGELERFIIPMSEALKEMPVCMADGDLQKKISYGQTLSVQDFPGCEDTIPQEGYMKITTRDNRLLAVIHIPENKFDYKYCCVFPYH